MFINGRSKQQRSSHKPSLHLLQRGGTRRKAHRSRGNAHTTTTDTRTERASRAPQSSQFIKQEVKRDVSSVPPRVSLATRSVSFTHSVTVPSPFDTRVALHAPFWRACERGTPKSRLVHAATRPRRKYSPSKMTYFCMRMWNDLQASCEMNRKTQLRRLSRRARTATAVPIKVPGPALLPPPP